MSSLNAGRKIRGRRWLTAALCATLVVSFSAVAAAQTFRAKTLAITTWGTCPGDPRPDWDDMCVAWWSQMGAVGYGLELPLINNPVTVEKFDDVAVWSQDEVTPLGVDTAEASLICTHGGIDSSGPTRNRGWYGAMHSMVNGDCRANHDQMRLGRNSGGFLRFFLMSSCNSMRWENIGRMAVPAQGGVHLTAGYHGLMYIGSGHVQEYRDAAYHGFGMSVGYAWVTNLYHKKFWWFEHTICPVAVGWGNTQSLAQSRVLYERYQDDFGEAPAGTNHRQAWAVYYQGCQPEGDSALP